MGPNLTDVNFLFLGLHEFVDRRTSMPAEVAKEKFTGPLCVRLVTKKFRDDAPSTRAPRLTGEISGLSAILNQPPTVSVLP
jgi:hypothetical protein